MYKIDISERTLHFKQPAGTSRGVYTTRHSYYLTLTSAEHPGIKGVGECATLPDLSCDAKPEYELTLRQVCQMVEQMGRIPYDMIRAYPSITFGLETAFADFFRQCPAIDVPAWATYLASLYDTPFARGEEGITINGLVWMGSYDEMLARLEEKLKSGFHCVKLKIGAIDFFKELDLIKRIRQVYSKEQIELRVDANGGFTPENAMSRLEALAQYDIHSIEQPIRQHQWPKMAALCRESPLPIALDEERAIDEAGIARHHTSSVHRAEALAPRRHLRMPRMDTDGKRTGHRKLDHIGLGEQRGAQCHRPFLRQDLWSRGLHASGLRHRTTLHRQHPHAFGNQGREDLC